jgi:4-hydroxybenzoate polyprenyltransferase
VAAYLATAVPPLLRAAEAPTAARVRGGVVANLHAMLPLQAALAARAGAPRAVPGLLVLLAAARRLSRKVTPT